MIDYQTAIMIANISWVSMLKCYYMSWALEDK